MVGIGIYAVSLTNDWEEWRGGWARTTVVGEAVECGDCTDDGELLEFCPHGDIASLGVVFCDPFATDPTADGRVGVVEVTVGGAEEGWERGVVEEGLTGGRELGLEEG